MFHRRQFLACALSGTLAAPALLSAPGRALAVEAPQILTPRRVSISGAHATGSIVILPRAYFLYHVTAPGEAMRYGIAVARS